ncbi:MAG: hypothetical protein HXY19_03790, partial [Thermoanaerobaculaceae bacterium]|nr:hypothetical protein [Thermoanaerobaculaceae bacterium]
GAGRDVTVEPPWVFATLIADGLRLASVRLAADLLLAIVGREAAEVAPLH